jgi:uncharacterized protein YbjT (DUF2867 family)
MILVTTPTGDIGGRVLGRILAAGAAARVIARDPARLPDAVRARVEAIAGSHADPAVIARALDGAEAVFWLPPGAMDSPGPDAAYVGFSRGLCAALPSSGVAHVVGVSALGRGWSGPAGHVTASLRMDDMIAATGVHYRALACASLMDNILRQAGPIRDDGAFYGPTPPDLKLPHVARADVAAAAARLLLDRRWRGVRDLPLCGPEDLTHDEMAAIMSDALGRVVRYRQIPMAVFEATVRAAGATDAMTRAYVEMMAAKNAGMDMIAPPASRAETPTSFRRWCETELRPACAG